MKAISFEKYGPPEVLQIRDIPKPVPKKKLVLVKVHASPVTYGDITARNFGRMRFSEFNMPAPLLVFAKIAFGLFKPRINVLGSQFSGIVESVGRAVTKFKKGDEVFGYTGMGMGAQAEYLCVKESGMLGLKPWNLSHEEACAIPYGGMMALQLLGRAAPVDNIQQALVNGASGSIGSMAVQILNHYGAEVTGVCSASKLNYVKNLGAVNVLDYTEPIGSEHHSKYDLILDILGRLNWREANKLLNEKGLLINASFKTGKLLRSILASRSQGKRMICALVSENPQDLKTLKKLAEEGKIKTIVDRTFSLPDTALAHDYYEKNQNHGQVIIQLV